MYKGNFMKKLTLFVAMFFIFAGCSQQTKKATSKFIKLYQSNKNITKTQEVIVDNLSKKNYKFINSYNHEKDALKLKQMLYPTLTIELNNPKISTKLISCNPTIAQELPIRIALYNDIKGKTFISFTDPEYWSLKHNIKDSTCINLVLVVKRDLLEAVDSLIIKDKK
jgi:uncharacterized protein (DUF302 family)